MRFRPASAALLGAALVTLTSAAPAAAVTPVGAPAAPRAVVLPMLSGGSGIAHAINNRGDIVGSSKLASGDWHAVLWTNGRVRDLGTLGGRTSDAWDIAADGRIVGTSQAADGTGHAVAWVDGKIQDLGPLDSIFSVATATANGFVVGTRSVSDVFAGRRAFVVRDDTVTHLDLPPGASADAVNDSGTVAGTYGWRNPGDPEFDFHQAYVWRDGVATKLGTLGGPGSIAAGINTHGHVVGTSHDATNRAHSFFWDGATMTPLPGRSTASVSARSINRYDTIIGTDGTNDRALVWDSPAIEPRLLPMPTGSLSTQGGDINDLGVMVGYATYLGPPFHLRPVVWR